MIAGGARATLDAGRRADLLINTMHNQNLQGTKMVFAGIKSAGDRKDLIAYLKEST